MNEELFQLLCKALAQADSLLKSAIAEHPRSNHYAKWMDINDDATKAIIKARVETSLAEIAEARAKSDSNLLNRQLRASLNLPDRPTL